MKAELNIQTSLVLALKSELKQVDPVPENAAEIWRVIRRVFSSHGLNAPTYIGGVNSSAKTIKGESLEIDTYIIYLTPSDISGLINVCPMASKGCRAACLQSSGRAKFDAKIPAAQLGRTAIYAGSRPHFSALVFSELQKAEKRANKKGRLFAARLNGTSDISPRAFKVNGVDVLSAFPSVQFYDYTKVWKRRFLNWPANYALTFSHTDGRDISETFDLLRAGYSVAVPFAKLNGSGRIKDGKSWKLPTSFGRMDSDGRLLDSFPVFDGDKTDARFLDRKQGAPKTGGYIVGLKAKRTTVEKERAGLASGFFVQV